jgi:hypothetical protein
MNALCRERMFVESSDSRHESVTVGEYTTFEHRQRSFRRELGRGTGRAAMRREETGHHEGGSRS